MGEARVKKIYCLINMGLYDEKPEKEEIKQEIALKSSEESRFEELNYGLSVEDSIIYLNG